MSEFNACAFDWLSICQAIDEGAGVLETEMRLIRREAEKQTKILQLLVKLSMENNIYNRKDAPN